MDCKQADNKSNCACASTRCDNHGVCCDCLRNHLAGRSLPACLRSLDWIEVKK
jgi:hypothetical protein